MALKEIRLWLSKATLVVLSMWDDVSDREKESCLKWRNQPRHWQKYKPDGQRFLVRQSSNRQKGECTLERVGLEDRTRLLAWGMPLYVPKKKHRHEWNGSNRFPKLLPFFQQSRLNGKNESPTKTRFVSFTWKRGAMSTKQWLVSKTFAPVSFTECFFHLVHQKCGCFLLKRTPGLSAIKWIQHLQQWPTRRGPLFQPRNSWNICVGTLFVQFLGFFAPQVPRYFRGKVPSLRWIQNHPNPKISTRRKGFPMGIPPFCPNEYSDFWPSPTTRSLHCNDTQGVTKNSPCLLTPWN